MEGLMLVAKGAEADLWLDPDWNGVKVIVKRRGEKKYRIHELDIEIRRSRTIRESSVIHRAKAAGVPTPLIYQMDPENAIIVMEFVEGKMVKDTVDSLSTEERTVLFHSIGEKAGLLHGAGIVHGDLTTSNIILSKGRVVFIDFGLSETSEETEKRGVDLNLMYRMLTSTHFEHTEELFEAFKKGYRATLKEADDALKRMEEIGKRGRYVERE
ncbi:MAG: Kae1-associated serine/threonine protein kinase [Candidatus Bathyarchaeota archaeon]|nr:MAG: Kae1-associated serine/threonine protein kinase [Candidatus Bathyarchaeota archaeon]